MLKRSLITQPADAISLIFCFIESKANNIMYVSGDCWSALRPFMKFHFKLMTRIEITILICVVLLSCDIYLVECFYILFIWMDLRFVPSFFIWSTISSLLPAFNFVLSSTSNFNQTNYTLNSVIQYSNCVFPRYNPFQKLL